MKSSMEKYDKIVKIPVRVDTKKLLDKYVNELELCSYDELLNLLMNA